MDYAILTSRENDELHWKKFTKENRVFVSMRRYRDYADVLYDTFSRKPGDRDRLTEQGIDRVCEIFVSNGCAAFHCGDTSGRTEKRIPIDRAKSLAQALCDLLVDDSLFAGDPDLKAAVERGEKNRASIAR
jgi:hypothetical protein